MSENHPLIGRMVTHAYLGGKGPMRVIAASLVYRPPLSTEIEVEPPEPEWILLTEDHEGRMFSDNAVRFRFCTPRPATTEETP